MFLNCLLIPACVGFPGPVLLSFTEFSANSEPDEARSCLRWFLDAAVVSLYLAFAAHPPAARTRVGVILMRVALQLETRELVGCASSRGTNFVLPTFDTSNRAASLWSSRTA